MVSDFLECVVVLASGVVDALVAHFPVNSIGEQGLKR